MGPLKSKKAAENYIKFLQSIHPTRKYLIFKVLPGTQAAEWGCKFGTCEESERAEYEKDGAEFV